MSSQRLTSLIFLVVVFGSALFPLALLNQVSAANVTAYIDLTAQPATAPSTISAQPEVATSTADEFYISYVASASQFSTGNTVTIQVPSTSFTSIGLCASPTTDADGDSTNDATSFTYDGGGVFTYTFNASGTTTATTTGVEFCFAATTPSTAGNYSIAISDTNDSDTSAALIYVGDANDVTVTATVPVSLSLRIKNPSTTADTNTCALGVLNPASTNTCQYRLAAGTSHGAGLRVSIVADDQLNINASPTNDIDDILDDALNAGTEEHGVIVAVGTGFTVQGSFHATNYENVPVGTQEDIVASAGPIDDSSTANWSTVTHGASINTATPGGSYTQIVTYRAYALT